MDSQVSSYNAIDHPHWNFLGFLLFHIEYQDGFSKASERFFLALSSTLSRHEPNMPKGYQLNNRVKQKWHVFFLEFCKQNVVILIEHKTNKKLLAVTMKVYVKLIRSSNAS